jgi:imidazolonepropionase-like amidohydrolase
VLPAEEILTSATTVAARLIGMDGRIGVIAEGAIADILVVDASPLDDIKILSDPARNLRLVMKEGVIYHRN